MKIVTKLGTTIVTSVVLIGAVSYFGAITVKQNVNRIIKAETEIVNAAQEMEINLNEAGSAVFTYLSDVNPILIDQYHHDIKDLDQYLSIIAKSATEEDEHFTYLTVVDKLDTFKHDATLLFAIKNRQESKIKAQVDLMSLSIEPLLDNELQLSLNQKDPQFFHKHNALLEIEINLLEILSEARSYLLNPQESMKYAIKDSIEDLKFWQDKFLQQDLTLIESTGFAKLQPQLLKLLDLTSEIIELDIQKVRLVLELEAIMAEMNIILDEDIQKHAEQAIASARNDTLTRLATLELFIVFAIFLAIIVTFITLIPMARHFKKLSIGIRSMQSHSKQAVKVNITSTDEFGELAEAFNQMSTSIESSNLELKRQIAIRDEALSLKDEADAANTSKSAFLAAMSHEIRTPLNAVIGLTELVLRTDLNENQHDLLSRVALSGKNLLALINDILDFSKISSGKLEIEEVDFSLQDVLNNLSTVVSPKADENGNEILIDVANDIPDRLIGDPLRLGQIFINLVGNAVKFTSKGEVMLIIKREERDDTQWLNVSVKDNGIGMTKEQCKRLFKAFTQADETVSRSFGGTGLGLSITKQLVEGMGGDIVVDSTKGVGSTFSFSIPLKVSDKPEQRREFVGINPSELSILIIDDNSLAREMIQQSLDVLGFQTQTAASGKDGIVEICRQDALGQPYDLVLVDWKMPYMNGVETVQRLRELQAAENASTIFMVSAMDMDQIKRECETLNVQAFLNKPLNTSLLFDTIMTVFCEQDEGHLQTTLGTDRALLAKDCHKGKRLLVAEDNDLNRLVAEGVLSGAGFDIQFAENGRIAIDIMRERGEDFFGLILMDIQMPEVDGLTATKIIRQDFEFTNIPILAMTAHALLEEKNRSLASGMNDHISKPIDAIELVKKVNYWLDQRA